jgi:hypothetical protein
MNKTGCVEAIAQETKIPEIDSIKTFDTCINQTTKGLENSCKCGTFLIPLCIVI